MNESSELYIQSYLKLEQTFFIYTIFVPVQSVFWGHKSSFYNVLQTMK